MGDSACANPVATQDAKTMTEIIGSLASDRYNTAMRRALALISSILALSALADPASSLTEAVRLYEEFQPETAAERLKKLLEDPSASRTQRAQAQLYLGLCLSTLGNDAAADVAFGEAFLLEPTLEVPKETLARILQRAESARANAKAMLASKERAAAEEKARKEAEAHAESQRLARLEAEARAKAEEEARKAAEAQAKAAFQARVAAEEKARQEALARAEAERAARLEAETRARAETEARLKAEQQARIEKTQAAEKAPADANQPARNEPSPTTALLPSAKSTSPTVTSAHKGSRDRHLGLGARLLYVPEDDVVGSAFELAFQTDDGRTRNSLLLSALPGDLWAFGFDSRIGFGPELGRFRVEMGVDLGFVFFPSNLVIGFEGQAHLLGASTMAGPVRLYLRLVTLGLYANFFSDPMVLRGAITSAVAVEY